MHCDSHTPNEACSHLRIGAVLLAAGEGSRLGGLPKSLMQLQGQALINRHLASLRDAGFDDIAVVTGFYYQAIESVINHADIKIVRNPAPEEGQQMSVRLGLTALNKNLDLILVILADQPLLNRADLIELISAYKHRPPHAVVVFPEVHGQRGNPVCFSAGLIASMLDKPEKISFRNFIDQNPNLVHKYLTSNDHFIIDIDTQEDVMHFEARTGLKLSLPAITHD